MLNIPTNPSSEKRFSVVSETYDLLQAMKDYTNHTDPRNLINQNIRYNGSTFELMRPSSNAPLREARVRSFRPTIKGNLKEGTPLYAELKIEPRILGYDPDNAYAFTQYYNNYRLYNNLYGVNPVNTDTLNIDISSPASYRVLVSPDIETFRGDLNNALNQYFAGFETGTFNFSDGSGGHSHFITNYETEPVNYTSEKSYNPPAGYSIHELHPLRNGLFLFSLERSGSAYAHFCVCRPDELATAKIFASSITRYGPIHEACAISPFGYPCVFGYENHLVYLDGETEPLILKSESTGSGYFNMFATNDKGVLIHSIEGVGLDHHYYTLYNTTLTEITDKHNLHGGHTTAMIGFNGRALCGIDDEVNSPYLAILSLDLSEVEVLNVSKINMSMYCDLAIINTIDRQFICAIDYNDNIRTFEHYFEYEEIGGEWQRVYKWKRNDDITATDASFVQLSRVGSSFAVVVHDAINQVVKVYTAPCVGGQAEAFVVWENQSSPAHMSGSWKDAALISSSKCIQILTDANDINTTLSIRDYKAIFSYQPDVELVEFTKFHADANGVLYCHFLSIPLGDIILMFTVSLITTPLSAYYTLYNEEVFANCDHFGSSLLNPLNYCIAKVSNFDEVMARVDFVIGDYTLSLCSPLTNNISQVIYSEFTEANVVFKILDIMPSLMTFPMYLITNEHNTPSYDELQGYYTRIIVEIDFIFEEV